MATGKQLLNDPVLLEHHLRQHGLAIIGEREIDPLRHGLNSHDILSLASTIGDQIDDALILTPYQQKLWAIAEQAGFVVALVEGLNQMPGTWPDPVRVAMNTDPQKQKKEEEKQAQEEQEEAGGPGDGLPPPPPG